MTLFVINLSIEPAPEQPDTMVTVDIGGGPSGSSRMMS
jgi:hypothetical protein